MRSCPQPLSATERKAVQFSLAKRMASPGGFHESQHLLDKDLGLVVIAMRTFRKLRDHRLLMFVAGSRVMQAKTLLALGPFSAPSWLMVP